MGIINQSLLRDLNTGIIMRMILEHSPVSRTDLADKSGLAPSTVTSIISDLQEKQYIRECGRATSNGGRRQILLEINSEGGYFIGVEINSPTSNIGVLDLGGTLVSASSFHTGNQSSQAVFERIADEIRRTLLWCAEHCKPVLGIGIGITGMVDSARGVVIQSTALGWRDFPLIEKLGALFDYPMTLENEASAAAFGEYIQGRLQQTGSKNLLYVAVGAGIGCGIIVNGNLYTGSHGAAGEIGHITTNPDGQLCSCGKHGCLETVASGPRLFEQYRLRNGSPDIQSFPELTQLAESGNAIALELLEAAGTLIGTAIGNQVNVLDLDSVILGGELLECESVLFQAISRATFHAVFPYMRDGLLVQLSALKQHSALIGAAALHWRQIFS